MLLARTARSRRTQAALVEAARAELRDSGRAEADRVAGRAGCAVATYYAHFGSHDEAVAAAFTDALDDLVALTAGLFSAADAVALGPGPWAHRVVRSVVGYFADEALVFRAVLARLPEHRGIREAYRVAERNVLADIEGFLAEVSPRPGAPRARAEAVLVFLQGLNNPRLRQRSRPDLVLDELAGALRVLVA